MGLILALEFVIFVSACLILFYTRIYLLIQKCFLFLKLHHNVEHIITFPMLFEVVHTYSMTMPSEEATQGKTYCGFLKSCAFP